MDDKKIGLRTSALLRLLMEEHNLDRNDIAELVHKQPDTVDRWLNGTNRLKGVSAKIIISRFGLPGNFFESGLSDLMQPESQYLSDRSVVIKPVSGAQIIVELSLGNLKKLVHFAYDLASDDALPPPDDDLPPDNDHTSD